jgi:hypothetical protein
MKIKYKVKAVNPVAKAMLTDRKAIQAVPPKRGKGAKYNRSKGKQHEICNEEF